MTRLLDIMWANMMLAWSTSVNTTQDIFLHLRTDSPSLQLLVFWVCVFGTEVTDLALHC